MNKKLFVFDMDGTLLNSKRTINKATVDILNKAMAQGHDVVFATGRNFCQITDELKLFPKIKYAITINGGIINDVVNKKIDILSQPLDQKVIQEIVRIAQSLKRELQWSNERNFYRVYFGNDPYKEVDDPNFFSASKLPIYDDWEQYKHTLESDIVLHIAIKCEKKYVLEHIPPLREKFEKKQMCTITETSKNYLDCDPLNINKYNAVKKIQALLGYDNENTYAFGDSNNDYLMIKHVGNGVAMGNARDELKAIAKHVIGDNDSCAIANFVEEVINHD